MPHLVQKERKYLHKQVTDPV